MNYPEIGLSSRNTPSYIYIVHFTTLTFSGLGWTGTLDFDMSKSIHKNIMER